jgi:hypothetical protein
VHVIGALAVAMSLAACSANPPLAGGSGPLHKWRLTQHEDAVFGPSLIASIPMGYSASLLTGELRTGMLDLMCFKQQPIVRIRFNYKIGSNASAAVAYRFDDKPGAEAKARFLRDHATIVIDDPSEVRRFLAGLATAGKMVMRVDSLVAGATNIELDVQGGAPASEQALAGCPLPPVVADSRG